jgi:hypothetical protein
MSNDESRPSYSDPIEVLLFDDHPHVRRLLREIIETYNDLSIVGEAINGEEAVLLAAGARAALRKIRSGEKLLDRSILDAISDVNKDRELRHR